MTRLDMHGQFRQALGAFVVALLVPGAGHTQTAMSLGCPLAGDTKTGSVRALNILKNRTSIPKPGDIDSAATLAALIAPGNDRARFSARRAATVAGYVAGVKVGGVESVNCHARDPRDRDTHVELTLDPGSADEARLLIAEVTPRWRAALAKEGQDWSTAALRRQLLGRWVEVTGWLLYDGEHEAEAANTHRGKATVWRATAWEIHPITAIRVLRTPSGRGQ